MRNVRCSPAAARDAAADRLQREITLLGGTVAPREGTAVGLAGLQRELRGMGGSVAKGDASWAGTRFSITTLNGMMEPLPSLATTLDLVRLGLFALLLAIILVELLNSFRMILVERTREIGTMRALGMQRSGVRNTLLLEALFLALAGALAGLLFALVLMGFLGELRFGGWNALEVFTRRGRFSFPFVPEDVAVTMLLLSGSTLLAAWLPA
jgi:putative ABC transport system permease protein